MKVRITSFFLAAVIALSATGCSLKKDNSATQSTQTVIVQDEQSNVQLDIQTRMIEFIDKIEKSNLDIDLSSFYNNVRTLKISYDTSGETYYNSYYDKDKNEIVYNIDTPGALEHELVHVIYNNGKELGNIFIEEGFTELLASEICETSNTYRFNVGMAKIFSTLLGKDKIFKTFKDKDINILTDGLSSIVPAKKDAEEFMSYLNYEHKLEQLMHQAYFKDGNLDNFKKTKEYSELKAVRSDLIGRIKIYIKNYYMNKVREENIDPKEVLIEMFALLDVVNLELFDPDLEGEIANDFFLGEEVTYIMHAYNYGEEDYDGCYKASKEKKYLVSDSGIAMDNNKSK